VRSNATCPTSSTSRCSETPNGPERTERAREDNRERLCNPARTTQSRRPPLRTSHSPDPPPASVEQNSSRPLDLEGSQMCARRPPLARAIVVLFRAALLGGSMAGAAQAAPVAAPAPASTPASTALPTGEIHIPANKGPLLSLKAGPPLNGNAAVFEAFEDPTQ